MLTDRYDRYRRQQQHRNQATSSPVRGRPALEDRRRRGQQLIDNVIEVDFDRFRMNGKALCLMTSQMFDYRVPTGGHLLYKDFQARLCRAVAQSLHQSLRA